MRILGSRSWPWGWCGLLEELPDTMLGPSPPPTNLNNLRAPGPPSTQGRWGTGRRYPERHSLGPSRPALHPPWPSGEVRAERPLVWQSRPGSPISPAPPREAWRPRPGGEAGLGRLGHLLLAVPRPRCQGGWACVGVPKAAPGPSSLLGRDSAVPAAEAPGQLQTPAHSSLPLLPLGVLTGAARQPATRRQVPPSASPALRGVPP